MTEPVWFPISTAPYNTEVDLWCIYGDEEFARYEGGASIGRIVLPQQRSLKYDWFGNQSDAGVPQHDGPDLVPVAWKYSAPMCPAELIAEVLGVPIDREAAMIAAIPKGLVK